MKLSQYITVMLLGTLICWVAWFFVIFNVDPFQSGLVGFMSFYASLFFALFGTLSITTLWLYRKFSKEEPVFRLVEKSFRDSFITAVVLIVLLYLQAEGLLTVWNFSIFIIFAILFGSFYLTTRKQ